MFILCFVYLDFKRKNNLWSTKFTFDDFVNSLKEGVKRPAPERLMDGSWAQGTHYAADDEGTSAKYKYSCLIVLFVCKNIHM